MKDVKREHDWVAKPWGGEKVVVNTGRYCGKLLYVMKGHCNSFHYHQIKSETFYVQQGSVEVRLANLAHLYDSADERKNSPSIPTSITADMLFQNAERVVLRIGDSIDMPANTAHCVFGLEDSVLVEFSSHHDDEDVIRLFPSK